MDRQGLGSWTVGLRTSPAAERSGVTPRPRLALDDGPIITSRSSCRSLVSARGGGRELKFMKTGYITASSLVKYGNV
jgi:hypothetical protein